MKYYKLPLFLLVSLIESICSILKIISNRFFGACVNKIYSVSILVGSEKCSQKCKHCGGAVLRDKALPGDQGTIKHLESTLSLCHKYGGWAVSLTGSGEPLESPEAVTKTLEEIHRLKSYGIHFPFINLFTNGFELVNNPKIKEYYLPLWKTLGLTAVAISIHDTNYMANCHAYNIDQLFYDKKLEIYELKVNYPPTLEQMVKVVKNADLVPRITLLLNKGYCDNVVAYIRNLEHLIDLDIHMVTSWLVGTPSGERNKFTPSRWNLFWIRYWLWANCDRVFNQIWGGGVYNYKGLSTRLTTYVSEHSANNDFIRQLVLFQDGTISYSWYQEGCFCLK